MKKVLNSLKEIMKPYIEHLNEMQDIKQSFSNEESDIEQKLENLQTQMETEMSLCLNTNSKSSFYQKYGLMITKDLEGYYKDKEEKLKNELYEIKSKYIFKLIEAKVDLKKILLSKKKEFEFELQKELINFDNIMLELFEFPYEYNDQQQVINGDEWRELFAKSNDISERINLANDCLDFINKQLSLTEITPEEKEFLENYRGKKESSNQISPELIEEMNVIEEQDEKENLEINFKGDINAEIKNEDNNYNFVLTPIQRYNQLMQTPLFMLPNGDSITLEDYKGILGKYYSKEKNRRFSVVEIKTIYETKKAL